VGGAVVMNAGTAESYLGCDVNEAVITFSPFLPKG
jgi:hypothetical protein